MLELFFTSLLVLVGVQRGDTRAQAARLLERLLAYRAVKELASKVAELLCAFQDEWFRRYGTGRVAHYPNYYVSEGITLSEDEVGVVNPEMFRTFFLPGLTKLSELYNGIGIHCCAQARHQWENFSRIPGLMLMNLQGPDVCEEVYDVLGTGPAHYHHIQPKITADMSEQEMDDLLGQTVCRNGNRTVIYYGAKTKDDALHFIDASDAFLDALGL